MPESCLDCLETSCSFSRFRLGVGCLIGLARRRISVPIVRESISSCFIVDDGRSFS